MSDEHGAVVASQLVLVPGNHTGARESTRTPAPSRPQEKQRCLLEHLDVLRQVLAEESGRRVRVILAEEALEAVARTTFPVDPIAGRLPGRHVGGAAAPCPQRLPGPANPGRTSRSRRPARR